jgi:hypothetical protein
MPDRIAVKRLTASDLTLFESLFRKLNVGNQKSINLNADVFVEAFYPTLPVLIGTLGDVIPVSLTIFGPGAAPAYMLSRAVTKREAYKNWRLNGEFVRDPDGESGRFDNMAAGDLAVFDFSGEPGPQKLSLLLISANSASDAQLFTRLSPLISGGRKTMAQVSRSQLAAAAVGVPETHPIWVLAADPDYDAALEDAALGGAEGAKKLATKKTKVVSAATLAAAKASAEKNGRDGEALAFVHLKAMKAAGHASSIEWTSDANAVSPFDFLTVVDGKTIKIDAKSTTGEFKRAIHMSAAELAEAASSDRYDLWRLYDLDEDGAFLRIAENIGATAKAILAGISLPAGVTADSVSIDPAILKWGNEITIDRPEEGEGD